MLKKEAKINGWRIIQITGFLLIILGVIFSFCSLKIMMLLYFGLVAVLLGAINLLIYYVFIGTNSYKRYLKKQKDNKLKIRY